MKIAFLCREDFFRKFGGDTNQILMYKKYWTADGFNSVDIIITEDFSLDYDFYVIVNIDRFLETFHYLRVLKKHKLLSKTSVLCIHHDFSEVSYFEKYIKKGISGLLVRVGGYFLREKAKNLVLAFKNRVFIRAAIIGLISNQKKFLNDIKNEPIFIFLANGEKLSFEKDFNITLDSNNFIYTKNGCEMNDSNYSSSESKIYDVLVSGRIEPRKNQLRVLNDLCETKYKVCFVGGANENNDSYFQDFIRLINKHPNIQYLGKVSPEDMGSLYSKAKVHLSASWFEVSSLVDLEAYYNGCNVISSKNGYTHELLGERVQYLNPRDTKNIVEIVNVSINKLIESDHKEFISNHHNWEVNSKMLLKDILSKLEERK